MKVLFIASECTPLAKVGGLADVVGSLPKTLKEIGLDVSIVLPFYGIISRKDTKLIKKNIPVKFEGKEKNFNLYKTFLPDSKVPVFLIENKEYFKGKDVYIEADASSGGSKAEAARFIFLSIAGIKIAEEFKSDIIHCHDWHVSLIPLLTKKPTFLTIHNLGYQGIYSSNIINKLLKTNFQGDVNSLQIGIKNANLISTVSPNYAKEILTKEYGFGLEKDLRKRKGKLIGILNGLDTEYWNPGKDRFLQSKFNSKSINKRKDNKAFLQKKFFKEEDVPLLGMVTRLADQKGIDILKKIFLSLMKENLQLIVLGKGNPEYHIFFEKMAKKYPNKLAIKMNYDEELAHQIYGGSDMFLMPSFFEPCGLGQLIAMRYGSVPIVRATGGLKDTVLPKKTGFTFKNYTGKELLKTIKEALNNFEKKDIWKKLQTNGMKKDYSWERSAKEYLKIYKKLAK